MDEDNILDRMKRSLSRVRKLRNRNDRYWKKLIGEALRFGLEEGIEICILKPDSAIPVGDKKIAIYLNESGEIINDTELSSLVRHEFPYLWRKYNGNIARYREELALLKNLYHDYQSSTLSAL